MQSVSVSEEQVHRTGLTVLYEPEVPDQPVVDIVFVHGLGGHAKDTWTWKADVDKPKTPNPINSQQRRNRLKFWSPRKVESETDLATLADRRPSSAVFWPKGLLPEECPNARILTWGYDSKISNFFNGSASKNNILSHANDLLGDLNGSRELCADRKLIFVAHSLGGIIVKQMLLDASRSGDERYKEILKSTDAVFFLGTPHAGSPFAERGNFLRAIAEATGFDTAGQNLNALKPDSVLLDQCRRDFFTLFKAGGFKVYTFQEARGLKGVGFAKLNDKVVPDSSSEFLGSDKTFTIDANHREMCRYSTKEDDGYRKVSRELRLLCQTSESSPSKNLRQIKGVSLSEHFKACLNLLAYKEMDYREQELQEAHTQSCNWILSHSSFIEWLQGGQNLLGIKGKPGSGKSTAMKKIFSLFNQNREVGHVQLAFFFHRRGAVLQYSPLGMFRSLLYQLLYQIPSAGTEFWDVCDKKRTWEGDSGKDWDWRMEEVRHLFSSALLVAAKNHHIKIFLDALDEAGHEASREIVSYIYQINEKLQAIEAKTSICFSCRHFPILKVHGGFEICVEDNNDEAIAIFISSELNKRFLRTDDTTDYELVVSSMQTEIASRAAGVFMWVALVIPMLADRYNNGGSLPALHRILRNVPSNLGEVYEHILTSVIDTAVRPQTLHLLQWIYLAFRPLSVEELRFAMMSDDVFVNKSQCVYPVVEDRIESNDQMKKLVVSLSGGLAEVKRHNSPKLGDHQVTVQFIHQSVNDFILEDKFCCIGVTPMSDLIALGHHRLSQSCINYFRQIEIESKSTNLWVIPFSHYAITSWTSHAEKAENLGISQQDLLERFEYPSDAMISTWTRFYRELDKYNDRCPVHGTTLLHIAAASNLLTTIHALIQADVNVEIADELGNRALHNAARSGHEKVVRALLDKQANINAKNNEQITALGRAARAGHENVVRLLLDSGSVLSNQSGSTGVLYEAALGGNESIVRLLLKLEVNVSAQGGHYGNALQAAAARDSRANIQLLLDRGADVNAQGGHYGNALQAAADRGSLANLQLLLDRGADVNAQGGHCGNALQAAAVRDSPANIQLLLDRGADVNAQGGEYSTALNAAKHYKNQEAVDFLLKHGAVEESEEPEKPEKPDKSDESD